MSDGNDNNNGSGLKSVEIALPSSEYEEECVGSEDDTPPSGIPFLTRSKSPVEVELALLRQASQEHGKTLGQVLVSISDLKGEYADVSKKLDAVIEILSKLKAGAKKRP